MTAGCYPCCATAFAVTAWAKDYRQEKDQMTKLLAVVGLGPGFGPVLGLVRVLALGLVSAAVEAAAAVVRPKA